MLIDSSRSVLADRWVRWIYTGDEVVINEQKDVFVVDRIKVSVGLQAVRTLISNIHGQELLKVRGFQGRCPPSCLLR